MGGDGGRGVLAVVHEFQPLAMLQYAGRGYVNFQKRNLL